jgi:hypothetical protein
VLGLVFRVVFKVVGSVFFWFVVWVCRFICFLCVYGVCIEKFICFANLNIQVGCEM